MRQKAMLQDWPASGGQFSLMRSTSEAFQPPENKRNKEDAIDGNEGERVEELVLSMPRTNGALRVMDLSSEYKRASPKFSRPWLWPYTGVSG